MLKQVCLLKRHPSLSTAAFRDYYETVHARIGEKHLKGRVERYVRRYLNPVVNPHDGIEIEPEYDVVTEVWFADQASFEAAKAHLTAPEPAAEILADEMRLFDREKNRFFLVEEYESKLD